MSETAIEVRDLRKTFGDKVAVDRLDLTVPRGTVYGFIGPNGAGKTTTIRMIMSILFPDSGDLRVLGRRSALEAKDRIGYLPEERGVYKKMKVGAFIGHMAKLKGVEPRGIKKRIRSWLERVDLGDVEQKRCEDLSKGMQQKVQFIASVIHEPELLILDEPFSGLDPVNMRLLRDLVLAEHERGATIIFSTHVMVQAEELCDRIVMIHEGRKVLDDTLETIRRKFDPRNLMFEPLDDDADVEALAQLPYVSEVRREAKAWEIGLVDAADPAAAMRGIVAAVAPARIELHRPSLEDIFVSIVRGEDAQSTPEDLRAQLRTPAALGSEA